MHGTFHNDLHGFTVCAYVHYSYIVIWLIPWELSSMYGCPVYNPVCLPLSGLCFGSDVYVVFIYGACITTRRVPAQDVLFALILWYVAKTLFRS